MPFAHFDELIRGVEMDLDIKRYQTYEELEQYCFRVASVVGLLSVEIFGYKDPACRDYAIYLGKALQLTNILRDVRADAERGRIYLPLSELERCRVSPEEILRGTGRNVSSNWREEPPGRPGSFTVWRGKLCPRPTAAPWPRRN